jgi:glycolate oxidase FAD binding subunit
MQTHAVSTRSLSERIQQASQAGQAFELLGHGSKRFYGGVPEGTPWVLSNEPALQDIRAFEPAELYVCAGAGMALSELESALAQQGQYLACEPPMFAGQGTIGGLIATGLSGPGRAYAGGVRDQLLGLSLIDGQGQLMKFGGTVMKNVAGFDVARLMCGAMGTLGLIVEATFKLSPLPRATLTLRFEASQSDALHAMNKAAGQGLPLSASAWWDGSLLIRLAGSPEALAAAAKQLGGETLPQDLANTFWAGLRHQSDEFFVGAMRAIGAGSGVAIWRLSVPSTAPALSAPGEQLVEWGGALRWLVTPLGADGVRELVRRSGGQATLYAALEKPCAALEPFSGAVAQVHKRLKAQFDPAGVFNPGRL